MGLAPIEQDYDFGPTDVKPKEQKHHVPCPHQYVYVTGPGKGVCIRCKAKVESSEGPICDALYIDRTGTPYKTVLRRWTEVRKGGR